MRWCGATRPQRLKFNQQQAVVLGFVDAWTKGWEAYASDCKSAGDI